MKLGFNLFGVDVTLIDTNTEDVALTDEYNHLEAELHDFDGSFDEWLETADKRNELKTKLQERGYLEEEE